MNRILLSAILVLTVALAACNPPPADDAATGAAPGAAGTASSQTPADNGTAATAQAGLPRMVELGADF